ncbi:MAG TPA: CHC2 zinc finger domain-containing protein, partial [Chloroflexota bacterium]|nr:CHC2 zinc finger domain-containing protein [Chloroflexota bacterium]
FVGLCPFHADHQTPNFYAYPSSCRWWCYVCKQGGDVIELVRRIENISFLDACEKLAGTPVSNVQPVPPAHRQGPRVGWECLSPSQQMLMDTAAASYRGRLWDTPRAVDWLRQRGLEVETIRAWGLGYCDGVTFREFMLRDRWLTRLAFGLGLLRSHRDDGLEAEPYETMAGRLVIPEYRAGHAIWFIGRLSETPPNFKPSAADGDAKPKYLGLPGARPLLGYERVKDQPEIFVCEGPFDWLTALQWGLPACTPCGTYVPPEQLSLIAQATLYGVLDGDEAGDTGHERLARDLAGRYRPVYLPRGMDLNQLGQLPDGRERFLGLMGPYGIPWQTASQAKQDRPGWWRRLWPGSDPGAEAGHAA